MQFSLILMFSPALIYPVATDTAATTLPEKKNLEFYESCKTLALCSSDTDPYMHLGPTSCDIYRKPTCTAIPSKNVRGAKMSEGTDNKASGKFG